MLEMTKRVKSEKFTRAIKLIIFGIKSGGELAELLDQTAQNLRNQEIIEARVRASISMYFIFIFITVCFAAPLLFGLSSFMAEVITRQISMIEMPPGVAAPITIGKPEVGVDFIITFVIVLLCTLSVFGSLILGVINRGKVKDGIKFIPIILAASIGVFFLVRLIISTVFSFLL
jgi:flagellar protein FlaJ